MQTNTKERSFENPCFMQTNKYRIYARISRPAYKSKNIWQNLSKIKKKCFVLIVMKSNWYGDKTMDH